MGAGSQAAAGAAATKAVALVEPPPAKASRAPLAVVDANDAPKAAPPAQKRAVPPAVPAMVPVARAAPQLPPG
eukprot:2252461-Prymnesium_polylepis.1